MERAIGSSKFCSDLAFEILSRTDLKSLGRCRTICTEWNNISHESTFRPLHCERTNTASGYFVQNKKPLCYVNNFVTMDKSAEISLDYLPRSLKIHTRILATSRTGIICCLSEEHKNYKFFVCKPTTKQWRDLPRPKMRYYTEKVAVVVLGTDPLSYKIVRFSKPKEWLINNNNFHCEIFDSNTWKWRKITDILLPNTSFFENQSPVVVRESVFCLLTNGLILNFDIATETYTIFSAPTILKEETPYWSTKQMIEYKGKLAFISQAGYLTVWVLAEDYTNYFWRLEKILSLKAVLEKERYARCVSITDADVAVMASSFSLLFYDLRDSNLQKVDIKANLYDRNDDLYLIHSDSEPIEMSRRC